MAKKQFKAESKRLLDLMINSIYTNKEIFLRELISNASDALDKLAYIALTDNELNLSRSDLKICICADKTARTLTISDNGIGMNKEEMESNLGTIAHSGSLAFKSDMAQKDEIDIIGQFGVGFYSAFMVARKVTVYSRKFVEDSAWKWESEGVDGYTITTCNKETVGTVIVLQLKEDDDDVRYSDYLQEYKIRGLVKKYSDYIRYPIMMDTENTKPVENAEDSSSPSYETVIETVKLNSMTPLWLKNKTDCTTEEYNSFYKEKFFDYEDPVAVIHTSVEGAVTFKALLYIPAVAPYDFYTKDYKSGLQLYSSGVLIMENCTELLPEHFRFVKGVVDTQDLSLNISREMLQQTRELKSISNNLEKKIKAELLKLQENDSVKYEKFYGAFSKQLKYGICSDYGSHKDLLQDLLMFQSNTHNRKVTFNEYCKEMPESQNTIYYVNGSSLDQLKKLPQTKSLEKRGFDVLLMTEQIDEFIPQTIRNYQQHEFKNILTDELNLASDEEKRVEEETAEEYKACINFVKETLGNRVNDVKTSCELGEQAVSMVPEHGMSFEMEKYFQQIDPNTDYKAGKVLLLNPKHSALKVLLEAITNDVEKAKKYSELLYAQGCLIAGVKLEDPTEFVAMVSSLM